MLSTADFSAASGSSEASEPSEPSQPQRSKESGRRTPYSSSVSVALTGSGGSGVMTAGQFLLEAAARSGYQGMMTRSLGPQIRGGEAAAFVRLSGSAVRCPGDGVDILLSFDWTSTERFAAEIALKPSSLVLYDPDGGAPPAMITGSGARLIELPLKQMVAAIEGGRPNMVGLGVVAGLVGLPEEDIVKGLARKLKKKGAEATARRTRSRRGSLARAAAAAGAVLAADLADAPVPADTGRSGAAAAWAAAADDDGASS